MSLKFVRTHLDAVRDKMRNWNYYNQAHQLYAYSLPVTWDYVQKRPYKGDTIKASRRMYLHLYYCPERALDDEKAFNQRMAAWQEELETGQRHPDNEKYYTKYFEIKSTPVRGTRVVAKEDAIADTKRNYGYFVFLSNEVKDAIKALEIYRNKDLGMKIK